MTNDEKTVGDDVDVAETTEVADASEVADDAVAPEETVEATTTSSGGVDWARIVAFAVLPALALILALTAGAFKYVDNSARNDERAALDSVQAAKDGTVALLSYSPDKVEQQLKDARKLLVGSFLDQYSDLIDTTVIPGAKQQQISSVATVPGASSISASANHAVVLLFVNQTTIVGTDAPSATASSVRVELDETDGKWLISDFKPV